VGGVSNAASGVPPDAEIVEDGVAAFFALLVVVDDACLVEWFRAQGQHDDNDRPVVVLVDEETRNVLRLL
jgi:hypothetical protein